MTAGRKGELNQNTERSKRTIGFPIFQGDLLQYEPRQWLRIYSQSIELAGRDDDIKALFFPMALETIPLQWFDKFNLRSIRGWEDLQRAFCENFAAIITHPITHVELK
jgi:hypothetical protein